MSLDIGGMTEKFSGSSVKVACVGGCDAAAQEFAANITTALGAMQTQQHNVAPSGRGR